MTTPLQAATQFFYDVLGHSWVDDTNASDGICGLCGREGPGHFDARPNHRVFRCLPCWSFYWPIPDILPATGKDKSFSGVIKNAWVLDAHGRLYSPVGKANTKSDAFLQAAAAGGLDLHREERPERWLTQKVLLDDTLTFPILWGSFGQNKIKAIQALQCSPSRDYFVRCIEGQTFWHNGKVLLEAAALLQTLSEAAQNWLRWGLPDDLVQRHRIRSETGLPRAVLMLSDADRHLLSHLLPIKEKNQKLQKVIT